MHFTNFQLVFGLFALVTLGGLTMLGIVLSGRTIPRAIGIGHGLAAILAVILLWIVFAIDHVGMWPAIVFTFAALGGLFFFQVLSREKRPVALVLMHGALALIGLYLLYRFV